MYPDFSKALTPQQYGAQTGQGSFDSSGAYVASGKLSGNLAPTTLQQMSIGLANGTIQNQADVNRLYGNPSYGSEVPPATPETTRYTSSPMSYGGGHVAPSASYGMAGTSALTSGTPTTSSPAGAFGAQNQVSGNTTSAGGTGGGYMSRYGNTDFNNEAERYLSTFQAPKSEEEIYAEKTRQAQGRIDALNKYYESVMLDQSRENEARSAEQNALSVMSGLAGSSEASQYHMRTENINTQANAKVQAQKNLELQNIYKEIQKDAYEQFKDERTNARQSALDVIGMQEKKEERASNYVKTLASSGFDLDKIRTADPRTYQGLADAVGGEDMLKAIYKLNIPKEQIIDKKVENGKYIIVRQKPDGSVSIETLDLGLPPEFDKTQDVGDQILFYSSKLGPDKGVFVPKGISPQDREQLDLGWYNAETARNKQEAESGTSANNLRMVGTQAETVLNSLKNAMEFSTAAGRSGIRRTGESWFVGATDYTNLVAETNTIKTNVLALFSDPSVRKFFGPQMSNADVQLMTSIGTTLNPELQSPEKLQDELDRVNDLVNRVKNSAQLEQLGGKLNSDNKTYTMPDGTVVDPTQ